MNNAAFPHAVESRTLADVIERVLDKGMVIVGDISIKLVDVELLTIQLRLIIASVDKAKEMGIDWWTGNPYLTSHPPDNDGREIESLRKRIEELEKERERVGKRRLKP